MHEALTDKAHWDKVWNFVGQTRNSTAAQWERGPTTAWIEKICAARLGPGKNFLEVGAGGSAWPAHIAQTFGATAWGIDISRAGLEQTANACAPGVAITLVEGDFFDKTALPPGKFDVIYSGGFIEHFADPRPVAQRLLELCALDGVVITTVPNLAGINGWLQRLADPKLFQAHVVFRCESLDAGHMTGSLIPLERARYLGLVDFGAVNFMRLQPMMPRWVWRGIWFALSRCRQLGEWLSSATGLRSGGRILAPMIGGAYQPLWDFVSPARERTG